MNEKTVYVVTLEKEEYSNSCCLPPKEILGVFKDPEKARVYVNKRTGHPETDFPCYYSDEGEFSVEEVVFYE